MVDQPNASVSPVSLKWWQTADPRCPTRPRPRSIVHIGVHFVGASAASVAPWMNDDRCPFSPQTAVPGVAQAQGLVPSWRLRDALSSVDP